MNKRLVWNFEIINTPHFDITSLPAYEPELWHSEQRFFWDADTIITLHGLSDDFLNLALYKIKERQDRYYVLPSHDYNIKERRGELLFKPLIQKDTSDFAFLKKLNLSDYSPDAMLPGINPIQSADLLKLIETDAYKIDVKKSAMIYKFATQPHCKLELARLTIAEKIYFSACVEGHCAHLVITISNHLFPKAIASDYVTFLKKIVGHHA